MERLGRLKLARRDWRLLLASGGLLLVVRLGLWLLPFDVVRRALTVTAPRAPETAEADTACIRRVGWAVERMSRYVPAVTCLIQAFTAEWLLNRLGQPTQLRIGAAKGANGELQAHSWLESGGRIVIGGLPHLASYKVLTAPRKERSQ